MHDLPLITTIAVAFTAAWVLGLLTQRLGLSPIVGYLVAGVLIGPHTPGFVGDVHIAHQLAEVGVILLMFGVGLHFHLGDLSAVKGIAIPGAVGQSLAATAVSMAVFSLFGMPPMTGAVLGMAMAVASTVVLMRVLMDADSLSSPQGHVAVGWLLVEDVFTVIVLVLIPVLGQGQSAGSEAEPVANLWTSLGIALLKLAVLVVIVMVGGARVIPWTLVQIARLRSRELFTLTILVFSIAIAAAAYAFFGASMALGAFLAGMVVAQSPVSHQAAADALPMRDAFAVLFFVSVGMLFDPAFLIEEPLLVMAALGIILLVKPLTALVIVAVLGHSVRTALTVALGLAQIGEFSFILSELARKHKLMPDSGHNVLVASAIISITINPLIFRALPAIEAWLRKRPALWRLMNGRAERRASIANLSSAALVKEHSTAGDRPAVVVGFGPVGRSVDRLLSEAGLNTVVVDLNMDTIIELTGRGLPAVYGDASHEAILEQAGMRHASYLVLTLPDPGMRTAVVTAARHLNGKARIFVRAHYLSEREDLEKAGATAAVFEEAEAAVALARLVLADTGAQRDVVERTVRDLRLRLIMENVSNIGTQRVRSIMIPWTRVRRLSTQTTRQDVLRKIAEDRFSRWPVTEPHAGRTIGYLLAKDLIAEANAEGEWSRLVRPMHAVRPDDDVAKTLLNMQNQGATVAVVEDAGVPVGLVTLEDILEQVVGKIEDEYPHEAGVSLADALRGGGVVPNLAGRTRDEVIAELAAAIPAERLPPQADVAGAAVLRERQLSTDLGVGVAIPHARCLHLAAPLLVFGRSPEGVPFSAETTTSVHLVFLLVTPAERPNLQLSLLSQLASIVGVDAARERLLNSDSEQAVIEVLSGGEKADTPAS
jgi:monovalent cation:H+ antiporter-2, CPA2 family